MISSRFASKFARLNRRLLQHTCTLIRYVASGETDEGGHAEYDEVTTEDVQCLFLWEDRNVTTDVTTSVVRTPVLYFLSSQDLSIGDNVRDVLDRSGTVTLLSRAKVNTIDPTAEGGGIALKSCILEGAVV